MKVLLYFEKADQIQKSGIGRAMKHQMIALKSAGVDFTINPKDSFDLAHINTLYPDSKKLLKRCKKKGIPVIVHGHSTYEDFRDSFRLWKVMSWYFYPELTYMYKNAGMIITPTPYSKRLIESYKICNKVVNISNGIELEDYTHDDNKIEAFKKHFSIKDGEKVVIGIGWYFHRKGIEDFIEVAKHYPDVKFIWFGYLPRIGTQLRVLKAMKHKSDNVLFPGYIANEIIKGAMQYASCLFFPSYEETEGIVILEALASYCPCLVRRIGVYDEWLIENKNCYMGSTNEEFIERLNYIFTHDNSDITKEGYKVVKERTLDKIGLKLKATYEEFYNSFKK